MLYRASLDRTCLAARIIGVPNYTGIHSGMLTMLYTNNFEIE